MFVSKKIVAAAMACTLACSILSAAAPAGYPLSASPIYAAGPVDKPVPSSPPGRYEQSVSVSLSSSTPDANIYYTLDGMLPDETSPLYNGAPIVLTDSANLSVIAEKDGVWSEAASFGYIVKTTEQPLLEFVAMSDVHIGPGRAEQDAQVRALYDSNFDVISSIFPNPDAILLNGDNINDNWNGLGPHHAFVTTIFQEQLARKGWTDATKVRFAIGNHDATVAEARQYYPADWFTDQANGYYEQTIEGYSFFFLNGNNYNGDTGQRNWLKGRLAELTADPANMNKPIFITVHQPVSGTVMDGQQASNPNLYADLKDYPQAIVLSGHSHLNINDDRSVHQKDFTSVNLGSMSYIEVDHGYSAITEEGLMDNRFTMPQSQAQFIEVYADRIEIERVAFNADADTTYLNGVWQGGGDAPFNSAGSLAGDRWVVELKGSTKEEIKNNFVYTDANRNKVAPQFPANPELAVTAAADENPLLSFRQAKDDQSMHHYEIKSMDARTGETAKTYNVLSEYYVSPTPNRLRIPLSGLKEATSYIFTVTGVDAYGNRSAKLQTSFKTAGSAPEITPIDPDTMWVGLVSDMKLDDSLAESANGATGAATQAGSVTYVEGKAGKAVSIAAGSANHIDMGNRSDLKFGSGSFTVSFWHKGNLAGDQTVVSNKDWGSGGNVGWYIGPRIAGSMSLNMGNGAGGRIDSDAGAGTEWHHYTVSVDRAAGTSKIYVDGVEQASKSLATLGTSSMDTPYNVIIGADGKKGYGGAAVTLDELKIWNRALTATEAKALSDSYLSETVLYTFEQLTDKISEADAFAAYVGSTAGVSVPAQTLVELSSRLTAAKAIASGEDAETIDQAYIDLMWALKYAQEAVVYDFIPKLSFAIDSFSSYADNENAYASNILDGLTSTIWHTKWQAPVPNFPHWVIVDMKNTFKLSGIQRTSRLSQSALEFPKAFELYASDNLADLSDPAYLGDAANRASGTFGKTWAGNVYRDFVALDKPVEGRYVKFLVTGTYGASGTFTSMSEIDFTGEAVVHDHAALTDLKVDGAQVEGFASDKLNYSVNVANEATSVEVTFEKADADAAVEVTGADSLKVGANSVTVAVSAHGETNVYTIEVNRAASADHALYLPFENSLTDYSPSKLAAAAQGSPAYVEGRIGNGLELKTTSAADKQFFNLGKPDSLQFGTGTDFTLSFWIKSNAVSGDPSIISNKNWNSGSNVGYILALVGSGMKWNYNTQGGTRADTDIPNVADGSWHHIAVSHDRTAGKVYFYKDGSLVKQVSIGNRTGTIDSGLNTIIGNDGTGNYDQKNQIQLDNVQILRKAVSAEEVAADYGIAPPIELDETFKGSLNLIGAQHSVQGAQFHYNLDLRTPDMETRIDKINVEIAYNSDKFRFAGATNATKADASAPGIVKLELTGGAVYSESDPLEYAVSRISELRFDTLAESGNGSIAISNAEFFFGNTKYEIDTLNKGTANVQIHAKATEDLNKDGYVTIGDVALGQGLTDEALQAIADKAEYKPYKRVVVIGIDGGGASIRKEAPYWETPSSQKEQVGDRLNIPNIRGIVEDGAASYTAQTTIPSSSSPNWGAMMGGVGYEKHGLYNDDTAKYTYSETWEYTTVFKKLREYLPSNKLAAFTTWGNIVQGHYEPSVGVEGNIGNGDAGTVDSFISYVEAGKARDSALMFFQLDELDGAGHGSGFYTKGYYEKLKAIDVQVGRIYDTLESNDLLEDTLIVILPDHGGGTENANGTLGSPGSHGQDSPLAKTIFFAANGRTVANDEASGMEKILQGGATRDLPATILTALGLNPTLGDSQIIDGMFTPQAELNEAGAENLVLTKVSNGVTGSISGYELSVNGLRGDAAAIDLLVESEALTIDSVEPLQAGVQVLRSETADGKTRIVLAAQSSVVVDSPIVKLNVTAEAGASANLAEAMIADAAGRETMPNLKSSERTEISGNAKLSDLLVNGAMVSGFSPDTHSYTVRVPYQVTVANIGYVTEDGTATAVVDGGAELQVGDNDVTVTVTAQNGTVIVYGVTITRAEEALPSDASLLDLRVNGTTLADFEPGVLEYALTVPYETTVTGITYTTADPLATVAVAGGKSLAVGDNDVTVTVTAQDGTTKQSYTIVVTRQAEVLSSNASLQDLKVNGTTVSGFAPDTLSYTVSVSHNTTVANVTYLAQHPAATAAVTGGASLNVGSNAVTVLVTAEDGTTKTYTVTVHRADAPTTTPIDPPVTPPVKPVLPEGAVEIDEEQWNEEHPSVNVELPEGKNQVVIPAEQTEQLNGRPLQVQSGNASLEVPAELLEALNALLPEADRSGAITVKIDPVADSEAEDAIREAGRNHNATYLLGGKMVDLSIYSTDTNGNRHQLKEFPQPVVVKFPIPEGMDPRLAGIYHIQEDGTLVYMGGTLTDDGTAVIVELSHFSEYALLSMEKMYDDLPASHWAYDTIKELSAKGIVTGVTENSFAPNQDVTRAEFAALLARTLGLRASGETTFGDVASDAWYADEVAAAYEAGIVKGFEDGRFAPDQTITREEMAIMIVRAFEHATGKKLDAGASATIADESSISEWALAQVKTALAAKLLNGRDNGRFAPADPTNRAEAAQAIHNLFALLTK
ncbi:cadherin-like beta sandwich domain-containing protein [Paenibacillus sp. LHD-117]|uniref:cadherin-like beta sandwich domain-containing protein n=1 Tax=Paenibacillus sp. LHD-117 TaxID=3071412 RepID=UPI0027E05297|nr:cadherin-like beta sandwich domain-containing protein [Paenibacillus sp. LHD-117]MDQ6419535.1 cadherin-like beta sandwich domain-containing protein [Paenibacillus sp. LHD-117]